MIDFDRERVSSIELAQAMRRTTNVVPEMQVTSYMYLFILFIYSVYIYCTVETDCSAHHVRSLDIGVVSLLFHANKHKWRF